MLAEDVPDQHSELGADVLKRRPVDGDVSPNGLHQLAGDGPQDLAMSGFSRPAAAKMSTTPSEDTAREMIWRTAWSRSSSQEKAASSTVDSVKEATYLLLPVLGPVILPNDV